MSFHVNAAKHEVNLGGRYFTNVELDEEGNSNAWSKLKGVEGNEVFLQVKVINYRYNFSVIESVTKPMVSIGLADPNKTTYKYDVKYLYPARCVASTEYSVELGDLKTSASCIKLASSDTGQVQLVLLVELWENTLPVDSFTVNDTKFEIPSYDVALLRSVLDYQRTAIPFPIEKKFDMSTAVTEESVLEHEYEMYRFGSWITLLVVIGLCVISVKSPSEAAGSAGVRLHRRFTNLLYLVTLGLAVVAVYLAMQDIGFVGYGGVTYIKDSALILGCMIAAGITAGLWSLISFLIGQPIRAWFVNISEDGSQSN